jgi:hypothetical protein
MSDFEISIASVKKTQFHILLERKTYVGPYRQL